MQNERYADALSGHARRGTSLARDHTIGVQRVPAHRSETAATESRCSLGAGVGEASQGTFHRLPGGLAGILGPDRTTERIERRGLRVPRRGSLGSPSHTACNKEIADVRRGSEMGCAR